VVTALLASAVGAAYGWRWFVAQRDSRSKFSYTEDNDNDNGHDAEGDETALVA